MNFPCDLSLFQFGYSMNEMVCICTGFNYSVNSSHVKEHDTIIKIIILKKTNNNLFYDILLRKSIFK